MVDEILNLLNQGITHLSDLARILHLNKKKIQELLIPQIELNVVYHEPNSSIYGIVKVGRVELKERGYGFIHVEGEDQDYYASADELDYIFDGDLVTFYPFDDQSKLLNAHILKVLERGHNFIIGTYKRKIKKGKLKDYIESNHPKFRVKAVVKSGPKDIKDGFIVYASIKYVGKAIEAHILEVIGHPDDPGVEISQIALEYGFHLEFPNEVIEELRSIPNEVTPKELDGRTDFRDRLIFTIDGDDSKDFDDAVSISLDADGNYDLGVYIADVSHYVQEGKPLNQEALKRGTSVYLADRVIPMLPHKLSNGICSLNEGVDRLVLACLMKISPKGKLLDYTIEEGVICSKHRMTYHNVNLILKKDQELLGQYSDLVETLQKMKELSSILRSKRVKKGGLSFDTVEYKFKLNADGSPKQIIPVIRDEAEEMIEDFMLMANETVAYHLSIMNLPGIYRIHEKPDQEKLMESLNLLKQMGLKFSVSSKEVTPYQLQDVLEKTKELPTKEIMNNILLRSMMKAKYSSQCLGHYGLAMNYYCHFTSPIRRYPDLMVHRILKMCYLHPENYEKNLSHFEEIVTDIAAMNSKSERNSVDCERSVNDMLFAWYMENHCYQTFKGMIVSMTNFGMFVGLSNGVEGVVSLTSMPGYFYLDTEKMTYSDGETTYHLGDIVEVVVVGANRKDRKIDFMMKKDYEEDYL